MAENNQSKIEEYVKTQLSSQRVGYLLGAGASYLDGSGYPLTSGLWAAVKGKVPAEDQAAIEEKLNSGASGIEEALDLLDDGGAIDTPYRHRATNAIAEVFAPLCPPLDIHAEFVRRVAQRAQPFSRIFSLNYDPLIERAAADAEVRLVDGFHGADLAYFDASCFEEHIMRIRGYHKNGTYDECVHPIHLFKLHGSLGWFELERKRVRRGPFAATPPDRARRLMVPPQRRKAADTMLPPYAALWSAFRGCLGQDRSPLNRLVCIGYGFADEHVNAVIDGALARSDFTLLILTKHLHEPAWDRYRGRNNVTIVTESRCSLKGVEDPDRPDLWDFKRLATEV